MEVKCFMSVGLILINCLAVLGYDDEEYCYSDDETPYGYFGTKTPYNNVRSKEIKFPAGDYSTIFVWALISHGTRHVTDSDELSPQSLSDIRDEIVRNHEQGRGELCEDDLNLLKNWKFPWDKKSYGELADQGKVDMENLAARWGKKFPGSTYPPDRFRFLCSSTQLSRNSAIAFKDKYIGSEAHVESNDRLFKTRPYMNASENKELDQYTKTSFMDDILLEITSRLGYENNLNFDTVMKLYRQGALEKANKPSAKSSFCAIFSPDHLEAMEYCDDLNTYYSLGYGDSKNMDRGCSLARDIFQKLDKIRLDNTPPYQRGVFNFGQDYNVLTLLTKLGLFFDHKPLKHDNYETQDSRNWRTSFIDPFASNIFVVMFNYSNQLKISFYVNEGLVQYPGCDEGVCLWSSLRKKFKEEILKDCPRGESSAVKLLSVNVQSIIYSLVLIFSLNSWCTLLHVQ